MSLVEFLSVVKGAKRETLALSVLYWHERYGSKPSMTAAEVRAALVQARITNAKNINAPDVLGRAGANVDVAGNAPGGAKLWALTETGRKAVRLAHGLPEDEPELEHGVGELEKVAAKVTNAGARKFLDEAILCLSVGALRAAIVFVWVGAIADVKERIWQRGATNVTTAFQKYNSRAQLKSHDDLLKFQESDILNVAQDLGVIDKAQKIVLGQALDLRNQCGHPNKYWPTVAKAKAHIEDIAGILWV
ncbi:hypothetical protein [Microbacterium sp. RURRCA19A]|uniref:hypothetical protein n=1 Tax=Microbacterium sp. RURRCA19A TaxID=1907391 RepID=UPI000956AD42|nr:hypothetical protein [Microbacterium sp. RURRCA19A]SIS07749.1 hypothetical protein SAMN05880568_2583 [Microbacterium sp. RURRCA19A]